MCPGFPAVLSSLKLECLRAGGGGKKINGQNWKKLAAIGKMAVGNHSKTPCQGSPWALVSPVPQGHGLCGWHGARAGATAVSLPEGIPGIRCERSDQTALAPCPGSQCRQLPVLLMLPQAETPAWRAVHRRLGPVTTMSQKHSSKM